MTPSTLEIDLARIAHNLRELRGRLDASCRVCAVVKANAYGMGAVEISRELEAHGIDMLAVYSLAEAAQLLSAGLGPPILLLGPVRDLGGQAGALMPHLREGRLHFSVHAAEQLRELVADVGVATPLHLHVNVNTGMNRAGMSPAEVTGVIDLIRQSAALRLRGVMSHASSADCDLVYTDRQLTMFERTLADSGVGILPDVDVHFAATYAALRDRRYHKGMIRVGLALLGYGPSEMEPADLEIDLRPAVRLLSSVTHVVAAGKGSRVGYSGTYVADRDCRLGLVPVGYAAGYPRNLANLGRVAVDGRLVPVRGAISMDQMSIDLTELPEAGVGSSVVVISDDPASPICLDRVARTAGANSHELLCRLNAMAVKRYVRSNQTG